MRRRVHVGRHVTVLEERAWFVDRLGKDRPVYQGV